MPLLLVATSARALAQSAHRSGLAVVALDGFADRDTRAAARACGRIAAGGRGFDAAALRRAADALCPPGRCRGLVYGSGFEDRPQLLQALAARRTLYGNAPEVVRQLKDPGALRALMAGLGLPFPETRRRRPRHPRGWLVKDTGGSGGSHVQPAGRRPRGAAGRYFQRCLPGRGISLTFLADGKRSRVIGVSETWTTQRDTRMPYRYAGGVSDADVPAPVYAGLCRAAQALTAAVGLRGLNGIDALVHDDEFTLLEVNPRPGATFELYDAGCAESLFALHLRACQGDLPGAAPRSSSAARAHAVVYAPRSLALAASRAWPRWCSDIPVSPVTMAAGAPVCMVHAAGRTAAEAKRRVLARAARMTRALAGAGSWRSQGPPARAAA